MSLIHAVLEAASSQLIALLFRVVVGELFPFSLKIFISVDYNGK